MNIESHQQMEGMPPLAQAKKALRYFLVRLSEHKALAYHIDPLTQSFALLTEAYASVSDQKLEEVREEFSPEQCDPFDGLDDESVVKELQKRGFKVNDKDGNECKTPADDWDPTMLDIFHAINDRATPDRIELFRLIVARWCLRCGGVCVVKPCSCRRHS